MCRGDEQSENHAGFCNFRAASSNLLPRSYSWPWVLDVSGTSKSASQLDQIQLPWRYDIPLGLSAWHQHHYIFLLKALDHRIAKFVHRAYLTWGTFACLNPNAGLLHHDKHFAGDGSGDASNDAVTNRILAGGYSFPDVYPAEGTHGLCGDPWRSAGIEEMPAIADQWMMEANDYTAWYREGGVIELNVAITANHR